MQGCIYTAQGEIICKNKRGIETFVEEKQNIPTKDASTVDNTIDSAIKQNYCDISLDIDPITGKARYSLRKECK